MASTLSPRARRLALLVVGAFVLVSLSGCVIARGSGNVVDEERSASGFSRIEVNGSGELVVEQGDSEQVVVRADDNLQRYITTEVSGDTLIISVGQGGRPVSLWPSEPIRYSVRVKELDSITLSGSTEASGQDIETDSLEVKVSGSGDIRLTGLRAEEFSYELSGSGRAVVSGRVDSQEARISGSGSYDAAELESKRAIVAISGSGSAKLWVEDTLDIQMSGSGSVEYYGSPRVDQDVSGSGSVKALGEK